jgi:hypothetical protein
VEALAASGHAASRSLCSTSDRVRPERFVFAVGVVGGAPVQNAASWDAGVIG